jgi:hypothetical protein
VSDERDVLHRYLNAQRRHVLGILDGLTEDQLRSPVLPSGWTCLGMVKHLALSDEHYWFRSIVGGEPLDYFPEGDRADWQVGPDESADEVLASYRAEMVLADAIITTTPLDQPPRQRDEWWGDWDVPDFRYIMLHVIAETACHAGHLDAARELIDGRTWLILT